MIEDKPENEFMDDLIADNPLPWYRKYNWYYKITSLRYRYEYILKSYLSKIKLCFSIGLLNSLRNYLIFRSTYKKLVMEYGRDQVKRGCLEAFCETGTEGFIWMVYEVGKSGYEGLVNLDEGDRLLIFLHDGTIAFDGFVDPDYKAGYKEFPMNPEHGQPCAFGCWIHWTQKGWDVEEWASLFFHSQITSNKHPRLSKGNDKVPYRAIVVKHKEG